MLEIYNYSAGKGDCLRIRYEGRSGKVHNIIVDSGVTRFGNRLKSICEEMHQLDERLDLLFITHEDDDHLGGLLWNLRNKNDLNISEVKMNCQAFYGSYLSTRQSNEVYKLLTEQSIAISSAIMGDTIEIDGAIINILWPDKGQSAEHFCSNVTLSGKSDYGFTFAELSDMAITDKDTSQSNRTSIVFEFLYDNKKILFTGDAWAEDIVSVAEGEYDIIKLPHHGSVRNISDEWENVKSKCFIIPTDGMMHPDKKTLAKLQKWNGNISVYGSNSWWNKMILENETYNISFVEGECIKC